MHKAIIGVKYIVKEVIIKFLFCYTLSIILMLGANKLEQGLIQSVLINVGSTLLAVPVVFIVYDLYKAALISKSTKLIALNVDKAVSRIFLRFIYFTTYFIEESYSQENMQPEKLDKLLKRNKDYIFNQVSSHCHRGYFIFSVFDRFNLEIDDIISSSKILKYIDPEEFAVLQKFSNDYNTLMNSFAFVTKKDFVQYEKLNSVAIKESKIMISEDELKFYDINDDQLSYVAKYELFDEAVLSKTYKLSGNKSKEVADNISTLYQDILKWMSLRNIDVLDFNQAYVIGGRLCLDDGIRVNEHMGNGIRINTRFK